MYNRHDGRKQARFVHDNFSPTLFRVLLDALRLSLLFGFPVLSQLVHALTIAHFMPRTYPSCVMFVNR